jgi:hypothetical protein
MMESRFFHLGRRAADLLAKAYPIRSRYLKVVTLLDKAELDQLGAGHDPAPRRVEVLAEELGEDTGVVRHILVHWVQRDLCDYSRMYAELNRYFEECGRQARRDAERYVQDDRQNGDLPFLLHGELSGWDSREGFLLDTPDIGGGDEDFDAESFLQAVSGYLVVHGLAFSTGIDLLETARDRQWPLWEQLWREWS